MFRVLRKVIWFLVVLPAGLVLVAFAVANRHGARLVLDPFSRDNPALTLEAPFFLFLFAAAIIGLLIGGAATWFAQGRWRRLARRRGREAAEWRREADRLNREREAAAQRQLPAASAE